VAVCISNQYTKDLQVRARALLFNSLIAFFVLVLALHNAPLPWRVKKTNLLLASYFFYAS
jgi:hypothetical protein